MQIFIKASSKASSQKRTLIPISHLFKYFIPTPLLFKPYNSVVKYNWLTEHFPYRYVADTHCTQKRSE